MFTLYCCLAAVEHITDYSYTHTYRDIRKVCRHKCARQPPPPPLQQCVRKQTRTRAMRTHCGRSVDCAHRLTGSLGTVYIYAHIDAQQTARGCAAAAAPSDIRLCANLAVYMLKLNLNKCPLPSGHAQNAHMSMLRPSVSNGGGGMVLLLSLHMYSVECCLCIVCIRFDKYGRRKTHVFSALYTTQIPVKCVRERLREWLSKYNTVNA